MKLNAACLLIWPLWLPCNEQLHSTNVSITTSRSAWIVKWPPNRTEADQGSKREGVYMLEQFVWTYYHSHPLRDAKSESNQLCVLCLMKIIFQTTSVLQMFLPYSPSTATSLHWKSTSPVTTVVLRWVKNDVLCNILYCNSVYVGNFIFQNRCEPQHVKFSVLNT